MILPLVAQVSKPAAIKTRNHHTPRKQRKTIRAIVAIALTLIAAIGSAQALPKMKVQIDDNPADIGTVVLNVNTYTVPFAQAVKTLFNGKATLVLEGNTATINYNGKPMVSIPVANEGPVEVQIFDVFGDGGVARTFAIDEPPRVDKGKMMIGVDSLAAILGVANDVDDDTISFYTPAYWCNKLKLPADVAVDRLAKNLTMLPEIGVTPPASTLLITVRGRTDGYAQMYKFESNQPVALMGKDQSGKRVVDPNFDAGDEPRSDRCSPSSLAVAETLHTGQLPKYAYYATIFTRKPFDGKDPLEAIRKGELAEGDWGIAGVRQEVTNSPILFEPYTVASGQTLEAIADAKKLSPGLIRGINGLRTNEEPPAGRKLMLIGSFDQKELARQLNPEYKVTGLHQVMPGETVENLVTKWKITKKVFFLANPDVTPGSELEPSTLISAVEIIAAPPPPSQAPAVNFEEATGRGLTTKSVALHKTMDPTSETIAMIDAGSAVVITGRSSSARQLRISYHDQPGFVNEADVRLPKPLTPATVAFVKGRPYSGSPSKWADEALKYQGTPYGWGKSGLTTSIDCSHFVEAIYKKVGEPVPSPPVHNMEKFGTLAGFKAGHCEVGGTPKEFVTSLPFDRLQPGDRIIMQNRAEGVNKSDHHTGLYLGSITLPNGRHIEHAMIDACGSTGVTVHDLATRYWNIYKYALHGSGGRWSYIVPKDGVGVATTGWHAPMAIHKGAVTKRKKR